MRDNNFKFFEGRSQTFSDLLRELIVIVCSPWSMLSHLWKISIHLLNLKSTSIDASKEKLKDLAPRKERRHTHVLHKRNDCAYGLCRIRDETDNNDRPGHLQIWMIGWSSDLKGKRSSSIECLWILIREGRTMVIWFLKIKYFRTKRFSWTRIWMQMLHCQTSLKPILPATAATYLIKWCVNDEFDDFHFL